MRETSLSMDAIVWNFHESLPDKIVEFEGLWNAWLSDPPSPNACSAFRVLIHRMSGATAAFGYEDLAARARELEQALAPGVCDADALPESVFRSIEERAAGLLKAMHERSTQTKPPRVED